MKIGRHWYYLCKNCHTPRRRIVSYPSQKGKEPKFCKRVFTEDYYKNCMAEYARKKRSRL